MITLRPHQEKAQESMDRYDIGQIIVPTGGGKTYVMIHDAIKTFYYSPVPKTIVVVAPRILLANQLCAEFTEFITDVDVAHVHSGETHYFSTTNTKRLENWYHNSTKNILIFTTYHSLHKVKASLDIEIDTIYYDEAHNGTQKNFFESVKTISADRKFYFTATPKISKSGAENGMDNSKVWGHVICNVHAKTLINTGAIVPPKVVPFQTNRKRNKDNAHDVDADNLKDMIESLDNGNHKILVSAPSSKILGKMLGQTPILDYFKSNGYQVMHITSKFGAVINGKKVGREKFFDVLTKWGGENDKKFVIFHYSILSEGINVNGLTHTILLRNLPVIEMAQTIGRVIRVHKDDRKAVAEGLIPSGAFHLYKKAFGQVTMPIGYRMGDVTKMRLEQVVNSIFIEGVPPLAYCI